MVYDKETLKNGLRLLTIPMPGVASVTLLLMVGAGSRYEEKEINGLSHFLEHMAFKGTKKRPTALDIATLIDGIGGEFNAFTSKDHTGYYIKAASKHLPLVFDVLSDMMLHSKFDPAEIEREKGVIIEEINMYEDMPIRKISDLYENLLYGNTKLGRDIAGIPDVIRSIKRDDFLSYLNRFYSPANTIVTVSGGIDGDLREMTAKYLGLWQNKKTERPEKAGDEQKKPALLLRHKDTQQAHLCIGVRSYSLTNPDRYKLGLLTNILGGGMSSRLFIEVRERRGLAYYVRSSNEMYTDVGNFVTQAGVDTKRIDDAIKVILGEFSRIREEPIKAEELKKAKENLKGKLILDLEDSRNVAGLFASAELLEDKVRTPEEIMKNVDKVTAEEVMETARNIFKEQTLNLAIIGPYKEEERFKKLLKL
ncbi:MAG: peptidase M16 domain-containing protein [Candidatus Gottesmanbacteria bacterium GW2011_GWA2_43_14]|uniref:Peptidase M16 domain-containing protein n=1 Tax=Candidatus Gottesmanbacteria bacterium GW2011_GWA2_43_14 TaxID=1618443 RepID=A0A0G1DIK7_9BACT|nr:MAG: peptidase M16 domain-containing protein [Candidatus Gottesmanbacteria bacterium GW2011_GWA2_43_14]